MALERITVLRKGIRELARSPGMKADLLKRAEAIASAAGDGVVVDSNDWTRRTRASVRTQTYRASRREAKDRTLSRAVDAGRRVR